MSNDERQRLAGIYIRHIRDEAKKAWACEVNQLYQSNAITELEYPSRPDGLTSTKAQAVEQNLDNIWRRL